MAVAAAVPEGQWYNELVMARVSASMKNDVLFRKLSQRLYKDDAVESLKDRMNATLARVDAHRYDIDVESLTGASTRTLVRVNAYRFDIDIESSASSHSGRIRVEHSNAHLDTDSEDGTSDSDLSRDWSRASEFSGDGATEEVEAAELSQGTTGRIGAEATTTQSEVQGGHARTRKGFFRFRSRMRRAKKHLAAAGEVLAEAGHKMMKAHQKQPLARDGVWMVNNPVYEFEKDMFEFAMGSQLRKRDAWSHLRYNSLN